MTVGALELPLAATGTTNEPLVDPVVELLLAFVGHALTYDIDPKLADWPGTAQASCPASRRFGHSPFEPRAHQTGFVPPSLWIWWDGISGNNDARRTAGYRWRTRELRLIYIFPELPAQAALEVRRGLVNAVECSIRRWLEQRWHPTFSYGGKAPGQRIEHYVADLDRLVVDFKGGVGVPRIGVQDKNQGMTDPKKPGRDLPGYAAVVELEERTDMPHVGVLQGDSRSTVSVDGLELFQHDAYGPLPEDD